MDEIEAILNAEPKKRLFGEENETEDGISLFCLGMDEEDEAREEVHEVEQIAREIGYRF